MAKQIDRHTISKSLYIYLQDNSKNWNARVKIAGSTISRSTGENDKDKAIAVAKRIQIENELRVKEGVPLKSKRFRDVANLAIKQMQDSLASGLGPKEYGRYIKTLEKYHIPFFDRTYITSINAEKLREFNQWRVDQIGHPPAKSTLLNHNAAMQMVFEEAIARDWIRAHHVPKLSAKGPKIKRKNYFTADEYYRVQEELVDMENASRKEVTRQVRELTYDYAEFAISTGMRTGTEMAKLTWGDLHIEKDVHGHFYFVLSVREGKTTEHTGTRMVYCKPSIFNTIRRMTRRFPDRKKTDLLFRLADGKTTSAISRTFSEAVKRAGLHDSSYGPRTIYSLRHSYITWSLFEQPDQKKMLLLKQQCGTGIKMIEEVYNHMTTRMHRADLTGRELPETKSIFDIWEPKRKKTKARRDAVYQTWLDNYNERGCI